MSETPPVYEMSVDALKREGSRKVVVGELEILIVDTAEGIRVYNGICPHLGGPLLEAEVAPGCIRCPWHRYEYDPATGRCLTPRALKLSPLPFGVREGKIFVYGQPS